MSLSRDDLSVIEGDARVSDRHLSEALGFGRVNDLHRLIRANEDELSDFGEVFCFTAKNPNGGRPQKVYMLNEHQAVAVCMWANTAKARDARLQIIEVFVAWRQGTLGARGAASDHAPFVAGGDRAEAALRHMQGTRDMDAFLRELTHLPIWPSARRPSWWHHLDVREFLTVSHRQMSLPEAERQGQERFGDRCPRKSAIHIYWQRLDVAKTGKTLILRPVDHYRNPVLPAVHGDGQARSIPKKESAA